MVSMTVSLSLSLSLSFSFSLQIVSYALDDTISIHHNYAAIRLSPWIFPKDMNNDQLAVWLYNCPGLMGEVYHHDIGKLKGINNKNKSFM